MKSILMSIQPKYCELIASGKKTIEIRKTKPKLDTPFKVYIYCTKGDLALFRDDYDTEERYKYDVWKYAGFHQKCGDKTLLGGKVIGEFICDYIEDFKEFEYGIDALHRHIKLNACIGYREIYDYLGFSKCGYGWHISNLVIYDEPKEFFEFEKPCPSDSCGNCKYYYSGSLEEPPSCEWDDFELTRPPQSWCYVQESVLNI